MDLKFYQNSNLIALFLKLMLLVSCLIVIVVGEKVVPDSYTFDLENGGNFLYKCSEISDEKTGEKSIMDNQTLLSIPDTLQVQYKPERVDYYSRKFNKSISTLFTFPLIPLDKSSGSFCQNGEFQLKIPIHEKDQGGETGSIFFSFTASGHLVHAKEEEGGKPEEIYFHPENYCVSKITADWIGVTACKSQCHISENGNENGENRKAGLCLPKCCPIGQVMSGRRCIFPPTPSSQNETTMVNEIGGMEWRVPNIYGSLRAKNSQKNIFPQFQYNYVNYHWNCSGETKEGGRLIVKPKELRILPDGRIYQKHPRLPGTWLLLYKGGGSRQFCMDGYLATTTTTTTEKVKLNLVDPGNQTEPETEDLFVLLTCKDKLDDLDALYLYPQLLFGVTLIATLIHCVTMSVYIVLWDSQNVHGWTSFILTSSQVFLNLFLCILFGMFGFGNPVTVLAGSLHPLCVGIGIFHHFLLICTFSWSTVFSFDAWSKIRSMTSRSSSKGKKRFLAYCAFGFGVPTLVVLIAILMEFGTWGEDEDSSSSSSSSTGLVRPGYSKACVIQNSVEYLFYITIVILTLFAVNMVLALHTLRTVWEAKKGMKNFKDSNTKSSSMDNKSELVLKLFVLMGVFLIFEIFLAFVSPISYSMYFAFIDLYRIFHALGLFWIFICNKRMGTQLATKFPRLIQILPGLSPAVKNAANGIGVANNVTKETVA